MKEKEILNVIKKNVMDNTPNILDKIDLQTIDIKAPLTTVELPKRTRNWKRIFSLSGALTTLSALVLIVVVVLTNSPSNPEDKPLTMNEIYGFTASSATILADNMLSQTRNRIDSSSFNYKTSVGDFEPYVNDLNPYLNMVEDFLGSKEAMSAVEGENESTLYPQYEYHLIFITKDVLGDTVSYEMYYDEIVKKNKPDEIEKEMTGIIITNKGRYYFFAEEEREDINTPNEEYNYEITVSINQDLKGDYIVIKQEREKKEFEYSYEVYKDDNKISESELEIETKNNEIKINLEIKTNTTKVEYSITKNNFQFVIDYKFKESNSRGQIVVTVTKTNYLYLIDTVFSITKLRQE